MVINASAYGNQSLHYNNVKYYTLVVLEEACTLCALFFLGIPVADKQNKPQYIYNCCLQQPFKLTWDFYGFRGDLAHYGLTISPHRCHMENLQNRVKTPDDSPPMIAQRCGPKHNWVVWVWTQRGNEWPHTFKLIPIIYFFFQCITFIIALFVIAQNQFAWYGLYVDIVGSTMLEDESTWVELVQSGWSLLQIPSHTFGSLVYFQ